MKRKIRPEIQLTELFLAKADWQRTFVGQLFKYKDDDGSEIIVGKIPVDEYEILAIGKDKWELGKKLDDLVVLILDHNLHGMSVKTSSIGGYEIYLN